VVVGDFADFAAGEVRVFVRAELTGGEGCVVRGCAVRGGERGEVVGETLGWESLGCKGS
jgi:hypothetical protein